MITYRPVSVAGSLQIKCQEGFPLNGEWGKVLAACNTGMLGAGDGSADWEAHEPPVLGGMKEGWARRTVDQRTCEALQMSIRTIQIVFKSGL